MVSERQRAGTVASYLSLTTCATTGLLPVLANMLFHGNLAGNPEVSGPDLAALLPSVTVEVAPRSLLMAL